MGGLHHLVLRFQKKIIFLLFNCSIFYSIGGFRSPRGHAPKTKAQTSHRSDKWTYYNLSDVTDEQLSERSNTEAAFSFLNSLKKNKEITEAPENTEEKHVFSSKKTDNAPREMPKDKHFRSGVLVMSEYEVGGPMERKRKKTSQSSSSSTEKECVSLGHLCEEESPSDPTDVTPSAVTFKKKTNKSRKGLRQRTDDDDT